MRNGKMTPEELFEAVAALYKSESAENPAHIELGRQHAFANRLKPFKFKKKPELKNSDKDGPVKQEDDGDSAATAIKTSSEKPTSKNVIPTPTFDDVVKKFNDIRSGKSLKNEKVKSSLKKYFNGLSGPERVALIAYLNALSDIIVKGEDVSDVDDPSEEPYVVDMNRHAAGELADAAPSEKSKDIAVVQDTPIVVGK